ncbi:MAG: glycosyl transferase, partial [Deltaproteobacteria bacterium]
MGDFYQNEVVSTLHDFGTMELERLEGELSWYVKERPMALVLPSLFSELQGEALKRIVEELKGAKYINTVVV